jgi:anti-anti-sigma regulatory factor
MASSAPLDIVVEPVADGGFRIAARGDLDAFAIGGLVVQIKMLLEQRQPTVIDIDLSGVGFLDATAAGQLARLHRLAARTGCVVAIVDAPAAVWWLLESLGFAAQFAARP